MIPPPFLKKIEDIKFFEKLGQDDGLGKNLRVKRGLEIISDKSATRRNLKKKLTHTLLVIDESTTSPEEPSGVTATALRIPLSYYLDFKNGLKEKHFSETKGDWGLSLSKNLRKVVNKIREEFQDLKITLTNGPS